MIVASQGASGTGQVVVLNGLTKAVQYTTTVFTGSGANGGVHTTSRIIGGKFYVFVAEGTHGGTSKIVQIDPLSGAMVDFLFESDPSLAHLVLG
jgi:hypothetical protein